MENVFLPDYRDYLTRELEGRKVRSPYYSLRAFARDLELSPSSLSEILAGRYGLSRARALNIGKRLKLNAEHLEHFADLMVLRRAKASDEKRLAANRVKYRMLSEKNRLSTEVFRVVADWHHFAILELFYLDGFQPNPKWMAQALKLKITVVKTALERLLKVGMLERTESGWKVAEQVSLVGDDIPSEAIRIFHKQILEKAMSSISTQAIEDRELSASILSIRRDDVPSIKKQMRKFVSLMEQKFSGRSKRDAVYCLSLQCFSLADTKTGAGNDQPNMVH